MKYFSFSIVICGFLFVTALFSPLFLGATQVQASTTVTPFSLGGKAPETTPQQAPALVHESAKQASPAAKPLFVKEGDIKPEAEKSSTSKNAVGSTVTSFAIPLAPALKKPGKAILIPNANDTLALTAFISDGQTDTCLRAIALQSSPLVAVRLESMGGKIASWKTKDVKALAQGVLALYQGESLVNVNDAPFSLNVSQPTKLDLCVQDSGALRDAQTKFRIIFFHADGTRTYAVLVH